MATRWRSLPAARTPFGQLHTSEFDLVLTDLRLDDMDGLTIVGEMCRVQPDAVRDHPDGATPRSSRRSRRCAEGAYDYLIKPCDVDELRAVVARGIERRQLGGQLKARLASSRTHTTIQR